MSECKVSASAAELVLFPSPLLHKSNAEVSPASLRIMAGDAGHGAQDSMQSRTDEDLWVFGYGSLMWRPGFEYLERIPARLVGLHRSLCLYSFVHRGTPEKPGLELGLDHGGSCRGIAYRVAAAQRADTIAYLRDREQVTGAYRETMRPVTLDSGPARVAMALVYVVDRSHPHYAGRVDLERQVRLVRQGHGRSGANRDYILSTVSEIEAQGCGNSSLHVLAERLRGERVAHV